MPASGSTTHPETPLRALIVDDERLARQALRALLARHAGIEIVGEAARVDAAVALIRQAEPDLVFLDVQLRGETGFDVLEQVDAAFRTIFVTAYDAYAVRAFEVHALDYLLKPIDPERLAEALARARRHRQDPAPTTAPSTYRYDDFFFHDDERRPRFIRIRDIVYIRAAGNYTELHLADDSPVLVHRPLTEWEDQLAGTPFTRIHRSMLVNLNFVERIERAANYTYDLYLNGFTDPLPMSRRRAMALKHQFRL